MNIRQLRNRIERVRTTMFPRPPGHFTFEEICRAMWRLDRKAYLKLMKADPGLSLYIPQFELEELESRRAK